MSKQRRNKKISKVDNVPNNRIPKGNEKEKTKVSFSFEYSNWFRGEQTKCITTYLKDESEFCKKIVYVLQVIVTKVTNDWIPGTSGNHIHKIKDKNFQKYSSIIHKVHGLNSSDLENCLWQFGYTGSVRLIAMLKSDNTLIPLLVDYHHLGYESKNYNEPDFKNYNYCPIKSQ